MCFFAIVGIVPRERVAGREMSFCPICGRESLQEAVESRLWFTLFFLPLFPVSAKQTLTRCECGFEAQSHVR